jgi:hypothetical protein
MSREIAKKNQDGNDKVKREDPRRSWRKITETEEDECTVSVILQTTGWSKSAVMWGGSENAVTNCLNKARTT